MKQIVGNRYLKVFHFASSEESGVFFNKQEVRNNLVIDNTFGAYHYCYVCYHSLTREKQFVLAFKSDKPEEDLSCLFWDSMLVLDTGEFIYLLDENLGVKAYFKISISLIGFYLINNHTLLILEEASFKIIDHKGEVVMSASLDLIEDFNIQGNLLSIRTSEGNRNFVLA